MFPGPSCKPIFFASAEEVRRGYALRQLRSMRNGEPQLVDALCEMYERVRGSSRTHSSAIDETREENLASACELRQKRMGKVNNASSVLGS